MPKEAQEKVVEFSFHGQPAQLKHGSVVIAAITSCTNTSNPSVMLGAGLVAKKACELGLEVSVDFSQCTLILALKFLGVQLHFIFFGNVGSAIVTCTIPCCLGTGGVGMGNIYSLSHRQTEKYF